jgi:hypothetical protein
MLSMTTSTSHGRKVPFFFGSLGFFCFILCLLLSDVYELPLIIPVTRGRARARPHAPC